MKDELIDAVSRTANLPPDQAKLAVAAMMRFFTARLPSSLVGELHCLLDGPLGAVNEKPVLPPPKQPL